MRRLALCVLAALALGSCDVPEWNTDLGYFYTCETETDCLPGWICALVEEDPEVKTCLELCPPDGWCGIGWTCVVGDEGFAGACVPDGVLLPDSTDDTTDGSGG